MRFIEYFKIGVVIFRDYKNPDKQFKDGKYFISDCNFYILKEKYMFEYCNYFMILGYFDKIHFDIFYNQETKKAIFSTKKGEEREFVRRICDAQNLEYFFGEKKEDGDYNPGWESFLEKHKNISAIDRRNYRNNKWTLVTDGLIKKDGFDFEAMVRMDEKSKTYNFLKYPPIIKVTDKESNEVVVWDISGFVDLKYSEDEIKKLKKTTEETTLLVKKYLWYQRLKVEVDNDGIHTNKYLYGNTGFTCKTPEKVLSRFYRTKFHMVNTYKEKKTYVDSKSCCSKQTAKNVYRLQQ